MLTGRAPFAADTISDALAAVLEREPDDTAVPADTPVPIRRLLRRCLEKDRKRRLDSAAGGRLEIDDATAAPAVDTHALGVTPRVGAERSRAVLPRRLEYIDRCAGRDIRLDVTAGKPAKVFDTRYSTPLPPTLVRRVRGRPAVPDAQGRRRRRSERPAGLHGCRRALVRGAESACGREMTRPIAGTPLAVAVISRFGTQSPDRLAPHAAPAPARRQLPSPRAPPPRHRG
jgi:hypothetical protein